MKKFKALLCLISTLGIFLPGRVYGFGSKTHEYVTKTSIEKISNFSENLIKKENLNEKEISVLHDIENEYNKVLIDYSLIPDEDENQGSTYKHHFFNPVTETNFLGEKRGALSKCVEHFGNALEFYKENEKEKSYQELGRAIHFLEDANTPVHTGYDTPMDSVMKLPMHVRFEKKCDLVNKECSAEIPLESLRYYKVNSLECIVKASAALALDNFYRLENVEMENDDQLAKNAVINAQKNVVGVIYKFINEIR